MTSKKAEKILLVRLSALGDIIQTLPILPMVRQAYPNATIGWAIDAELVPALAGHPDVDKIHVCPRKRWMRELKHPGKWFAVLKEMSKFINEMRAVGYDTVVDLQGLFKTGLISYLTGVKRRIGFAHGREMTGIFYNEKYLTYDEYFDPSTFHLEHMQTLSKAIGCSDMNLRIDPPPVSQEVADKIGSLIKNTFVKYSRIVAIAPGTQWETKLWPTEYWVELINRILAETHLNVVMVGSRGDAELVNQILQAIPQSKCSGRVLNLAGITNIPEMYATYARVDIAIGSDSAPLHIAGALKVPHLIGLYGPTGYLRTPPIGSPDIKLFSTEGTLACQPCHKKTCRLGTTECMTAITPAQVFQHIKDLGPEPQPIVVTHSAKKL